MSELSGLLDAFIRLSPAGTGLNIALRDILGSLRCFGDEAEDNLRLRLHDLLHDFGASGEIPDPPPMWARKIAALYYNRAMTFLPGDIIVKWDGHGVGEYGSVEEAMARIRASSLYAGMPEARDDYWFFEVLGPGGKRLAGRPDRPGWHDEEGRRVINGLAVRELGNLLSDDAIRRPA